MRFSSFYFAICFILLGSFFIFAETEISVDTSLVAPIGWSSDDFSMGGQVEAVVRFPLFESIPLLAGGSLGYQYLQTNGGRPLNSVLLAGRASYTISPLPFMKITPGITLGSYMSLYQPLEGVSGEATMLTSFGVYGGLNIDTVFDISPGIDVLAGAGYNFYPGYKQEMLFSIGVTLYPEQLAARPRIKIEQIQLDPLFPALLHHYRDNPIGSILFTNNEGSDLSDFTMTLSLDGISESPTLSYQSELIEKDAILDLPLKVLFSDDILSSSGIESNGEIVISYIAKDREKTATAITSVIIYNSNAITWDDDRKAASFVTSLDPAILGISRNVISNAADWQIQGFPKSIPAAISMLNTMNELGLNYLSDPSSPFEKAGEEGVVDFVQFPLQTIEYKAGDCDDLTVLYTALLEAIGIKTAFITVPGHIYAAVSMEMSPRDARFWISNTDLIINHQGTAWLPVEVTFLDQGFLRAWESGARQWNSYNENNKAMLFPLSEAWQEYAAVSYSEEELTLSDQLLKNSNRVSRKEFNNFVENELYEQESALLQRIAMRPGPSLKNKLAIVYARFGEIRQAVNILKDLTRTNPEYSSALVNLGNIYFLEGDFTSASRYFTNALSIKPDNPAISISLARSEYLQGNSKEAARLHEVAAGMSPDLAERFSYLGSGQESASRADDQNRGVIWLDEE